MWRAKLPFALLLLLCLMMLVDQFLFATQEKTGFVDQATLVEKYPRVQYRRWRRWNEKPGPTWNKYTTINGTWRIWRTAVGSR